MIWIYNVSLGIAVQIFSVITESRCKIGKSKGAVWLVHTILPPHQLDLLITRAQLLKTNDVIS